MSIEFVPYTDIYKSEVEKLLTELTTYLAQFNKFRRRTPDPTFGQTYLQTLLKKISTKGGAIFVALDNNHSVGCVTGWIKQPSEEDLLEYLPHKEGYIADLYVNPDYRHKNIGATLIEKIEVFFKQNGCSDIEINVRNNNTAAYNLYKKVGFKDSDTNLQKSI